MKELLLMLGAVGLVFASPIQRGKLANPIAPFGEVKRSEFDLGIISTEVCTVYVDDDYDYSTPGFGYDHFNRIQEAINTLCASCSGQKLIIVHEGIYFRAWGFDNGSGLYDSTDTGPIEVWCDNVTIEGISNPLIKTIVDSPSIFDPNNPPYVEGIRLLNVYGNNVTVKGLHLNGRCGVDSYDGTYPDTFSMARSGILVFPSYGNVTIRDCRVDSCLSGIIALNDASNILCQGDTIVDCGVDGTLGAGILLLGAGTNGAVLDNSILSNRIDGYFQPIGIIFHQGASGAATGNNLKHLGYGIAVNGNQGDCIINENTIDSSQIGVQILNSADTVFIYDNTIGIYSIGARPPYDGIDLFGSQPGMNLMHFVYRNSLIGDGSNNTIGFLITDDFYWGMADTMRLDIYQNSVSGFDYGVYILRFNESQSFFSKINIVENQIYGNNLDGIFLADSGHTLWGPYVSIPIWGVKISKNSIYGNGELGIDLEKSGETDPGVTPNDIGDNDEGPNNLYNFPVVSEVIYYPNQGLWRLKGTAHPMDLIEVFKADGDPSGYGEGLNFLEDTVADLSGQFDVIVSDTLPFTLTAIDVDSNNTSEFSQNVDFISHIASDFVRGDANGDGTFNVSDGVFIVTHLLPVWDFLCNDAADCNDDGTISIADAVFLLGHLFPTPDFPPPFPSCGQDPTADTLYCTHFPPCIVKGVVKGFGSPLERYSTKFKEFKHKKYVGSKTKIQRR